MSNGVLNGMLIGDILSRDHSAGYPSNADVAAAKRGADNAKEASDWRKKAMGLRCGVVSRKMSETLLLEALKQENPRHPLASRDVIEKITDEVYDAQIAIWDADPAAYAQKTMNERPVIDERELAALREKYLPAKPSHPATGGAGEEHESHGHDGAGMESAPKG